MKITIRINKQNVKHCHFTLFCNGANCGKLCMEAVEFTNFVSILQCGINPNIDTLKLMEWSDD